MKKASLLLSLLLMAMVSLSAQETVELVFTANTQEGLYCPFDAVNVTNVTRGWTETLAYPDTVLVLNSIVGLDEHNGKTFRLGEAFPNPFMDETQVLLEMPESDEVLVQVVCIDGNVVASIQRRLDAGLHCVKVGLSSPTMAFLVVTTKQERHVVRMLSMGNCSTDAISVETLSVEYNAAGQSMRSDATGDFQPGDMMRYTAVLFDGINTVYSNTITQQQYESQTVLLYFDLTLPEVVTAQVTDVTQSEAMGGGEVTATGGVSVTERGICWGTSHNPTIGDSHSNNGTGIGTFTVNMTDLTANTNYYVRAYAINSIGTAYGNEVSFTTSDIPSYTIAVSANPSNGGIVSGGGTYQQGQSCTVTASANSGYEFANWTEGDSVVSNDASYSFIVMDNRSIMAHFSFNAGGHEYVDLGLPSGLLWATCNVGAETPESFGNYYAWGETQNKSQYGWGNYLYCHNSENKLTKYCNNPNYGYNGYTDDLITLLPEDDAATLNWGGNWRMPTQEEWEELIQNTTNSFATQNGKNGWLFTSSNGNTLFLPAAGYRNEVGLYLGDGVYRSSSLFLDNPSSAWTFGFHSSCGLSDYNRCNGYSIRPVYPMQ